MSSEFIQPRQEIAAAAAVAVPPALLGFNDLRSVVFAGDGRRGRAVGENGTILATQNGGESWQTQTSGTTNSLLSVVFAGDGRRGWAVGENGTIIRLDPPDLAPLSAAVDLKGVQAALNGLGISDQAIGPPLEIMKRFETNRDDRKEQLRRDEADLVNKRPAYRVSFQSRQILWRYSRLSQELVSLSSCSFW